jgi:hypothetical protein
MHEVVSIIFEWKGVLKCFAKCMDNVLNHFILFLMDKISMDFNLFPK